MHNDTRKTLLVGSMPFENERDAMSQALNILGTSLISLPDGEIGEKSEQYPNGYRAAWTQAIIDLCEADPKNWKVVRKAIRGENGFPVDYNHTPRLKPKHPPKAMAKHLDFRWLKYFKDSYPIFKDLREKQGTPELKFQVGLPTGLGIAFAMMSPINAFKYADAFNQRMAYEANEMLKIAGPENLQFQLEVPGELAMAYRLPKFMVGITLRSIFGLVTKLHPEAQVGIHLCLGDLNNEALTKAPSLDKMVHFSNKLVSGWSSPHKLLYIHYPLAEAAEPPPLQKAYYMPLKRIKLPENTRFVAGFVHDKRNDEENHQILRHIEDIRGHKVDIACSCGLGRRSPDTAKQLLQLQSTLAA